MSMGMTKIIQQSCAKNIAQSEIQEGYLGGKKDKEGGSRCFLLWVALVIEHRAAWLLHAHQEESFLIMLPRR